VIPSKKRQIRATYLRRHEGQMTNIGNIWNKVNTTRECLRDGSVRR
jgi:hypothetical protein